MPGAKKLAAWLSAWLAVAVLTTIHTCVPSMHASAQPMARNNQGVSTLALGALGEVPPDRRSEGDPGGGALARALRSGLRDVRGVRLTARPHARYLINASVASLTHERDRRAVRVRCEVSVMVSERDSGTVRLLLSGRAEAQDLASADAASSALERRAIEAAVRGALRPLPDGLMAIRP